MDHPADDVDLTVAVSSAHGYVRAQIALTVATPTHRPTRRVHGSGTLAV
jgi:hypothetical protein